MNTKPDGSPEKLSKEHGMFAQMVGDWDGITNTWFHPEVIADGSPWIGRSKLTLGGLFVLYEYQGSLLGEYFEGVVIYGFDKTKGKIISTWVDSYHKRTGIILSQGEKTKQGFSVLGSYPDSGGGPDWGWRTEIIIVDTYTLTITAYNITPDNQEAKAIETQYKRREYRLGH